MRAAPMGPRQHVAGRAGEVLAPEDRRGVEDEVILRAGVDRGHPVLRVDSTLQSSSRADDLQARDVGRRVAVILPADQAGVEDFWQGFASNAMCNLHILLHHGRNTHHIAEAIFKATARAIRIASEIDPRQTGVPSSKGVL